MLSGKVFSFKHLVISMEISAYRNRALSYPNERTLLILKKESNKRKIVLMDYSFFAATYNGQYLVRNFRWSIISW